MIARSPSRLQGSTRDRLVTAGIRLFAERGFRATTVGDIEKAAGLQPRRGALYRHFPTKEALLRAAVETHLASVEAGLDQMDELPGVDARTEALLAGRWFLRELDAARQLFHILEQDGDRLHDIRDLVRHRIIDAGHRRVAELLQRRLQKTRADLDTEALAVMVVGSLANHRRAAWTFGSPPLGVDDDRLLNTWTETIATLIDAVS